MGATEFGQNLKELIAREKVMDDKNTVDPKAEAHLLQQLDNWDEMNQFIDKALESRTVVEENLGRVAARLGEYLAEKFQVPGFAIVLLGGAAHGGGELRRLIDNPGSGDFDWAIVTDDDSLTQEERRIIRLEVEKHIRQLGQEEGAGVDLQSCDQFNSENFHYQNYQDAGSCLVEMHMSASSEQQQAVLVDHLVTFFEPLYPMEIGRMNRENILTALQELHDADQILWKKITTKMKIRWQSMHILKHKHAGEENRSPVTRDVKQNQYLASQISSDDSMSQPFFALLDATAL